MLNFIPLSLSLVCSTDNNNRREVVLDSLEKVVSCLEKVVLGSLGETIWGSSRVGWCSDTHKPIGYDQ